MTRLRDRVVLLHGLWLRSATMGYLQRRLCAAGLDARLFDYASQRESVESASGRLRQTVSRLDGTVHLVGHSLGGMLAALAVQRDPGLINGRIVCLGSPLRGSAAARAFNRLPGGAALLGCSAQPLLHGLDRWDGPQALGVIAGQLPLGLGFLSGGVQWPHDGTVAVAETRLAGVADHRVIAAAHTGLVYSNLVARHIATFVREGRFGH